LRFEYGEDDGQPELNFCGSSGLRESPSVAATTAVLAKLNFKTFRKVRVFICSVNPPTGG